MCKILLKPLMEGKNYPDAGETLYYEIVKHINDSEKVVVDMTGIDALPSMFLNTSIGRIIDQYGKQSLKDHVAFAMITRSQAMRLHEYLERYK